MESGPEGCPPVPELSAAPTRSWFSRGNGAARARPPDCAGSASVLLHRRRAKSPSQTPVADGVGAGRLSASARAQRCSDSELVLTGQRSGPSTPSRLRGERFGAASPTPREIALTDASSG